VAEHPHRREDDDQHEEVYEFVRQEVKKGRQVYIVYPLVEESEKLDLKAATEGYEHLRTEVFPEFRVGLIHGRLFAYEKDDIMNAFKRREIDVLVSTTVIEVGIDVANATVMVIENAERFGLSQLHQLRGRVGRGSEQSYCILVAKSHLRFILRTISAEEQREMHKTQKRLETMIQTTDGFKIAEVDLEVRGPGDFFGTRQSGLPDLRIANIATDGEILMAARKEAFNLVDYDPQLRHPNNMAIRAQFQTRYRGNLALARVG
jgi:ATP-dependent DNA helicase RecG